MQRHCVVSNLYQGSRVQTLFVASQVPPTDEQPNSVTASSVVGDDGDDGADAADAADGSDAADGADAADAADGADAADAADAPDPACAIDMTVTEGIV